MGTERAWVLVLMATVPGCISVPQIGNIWMGSSEHECATVRAHTHTEPLVFATVMDAVLPAWRARIDASSSAGSPQSAPARIGLATVRGLGTDAPEAIITVLRIDARAADGSIERTFAYAEGVADASGAPPGDLAVTRFARAGLVIDGVARRGTERAILVGTVRDEGGAHGVIAFSPGGPGLVLRETQCRAPAPDAPSPIEAAPTPPPAPPDDTASTTAPVRVPDRVDVPVQIPTQVPMEGTAPSP